MRVALLFFAAVVFAQSQPPSPTPSKIGQVNQKQAESKSTKTETNQQPSIPSPVSIFQNFAPLADGKQQQSSNPAKNNAPTESTFPKITDAVLALATVAIAVLAFFQWQTLKDHKRDFEAIATNMGLGLTETTKAANAARDSAEAAKQSLVLTHRPKLAVRNLVIEEPSYGNRFISGRAQEQIFKPNTEIKGNLRLINSGNGAATIQDSPCWVINSGEPDRLPRDLLGLTRISPDPLVPAGTIAKPGQILEGQFSGAGPSLDQQKEIIRLSPKEVVFLYVIGWINYADEFGNVRRTSFCRLYKPELDRFIPLKDDPDYESED